MGTISTDANSVFRDFVVNGVPSSGEYQPPKADIRSLFALVEQAQYILYNDGATHLGVADVQDAIVAIASQIGPLVAAAISAGAVVHATKSALLSDTSHPAGTLGFVYADPTSSNNGVYALQPLSPPSWVFTGVTLASVVTLSMLGSDVLDYIDGEPVTYGQNPPSSGGNTGNGGNSFISGSAAGQSGYMTQAQIESVGSGMATLFVCSVSGLTATLLQSVNVLLASGLNTINPLALGLTEIVEEGQYIGLYSATSLLSYSLSGSGGYWSAAGLISGSGTTVAAGASSDTLEIGFTITNGILGETSRAEGQESALNALITGSTANQGANPPVAGTSASSAGDTRFSDAQIEASGVMSSFSFYPRVSGPVTIAFASMAAGNFTIQGTPINVTAVGGQVNTVAIDQLVQEGWWVGIYSTTTIPDFVTAAGVTSYSCSGLVGASSASVTNANLRFEMGWTLISGALSIIEWLINQGGLGAISGAGIGLLSGADPTGVADSTAAFASALTTHPHPYVPPGTYSLTAIQNEGKGLWGPGSAIVKVAGVVLSLPEAPERYSRWLSLRARLVSQIYSGSALIINGDSITNGFQASVFENSFVSLLTRYANLGIALDEAVFVNWDTTDTSGGPAFEGITFTSPSTGTNGTGGPVSKSLELAAGQSIAFTGAYERVDITYNGSSGPALSFAFNGTPYATPAVAGSGSDVDTGAGLTGHAGLGNYTITNTGSSALEVTSLIRLGVKTVNSPPRLYVCRFAHGGYAFSSFGSGQVASMLRIATAVGGGTRPVVIPALGTNDEAGAGDSYATLYSSVTAYVALWVGAGVPVRSILPIMPWRWSNYPTGASFEQGDAAIRDAFADAGITQFVKTDGLDMIAFGLSAGGGHPYDSGHRAEFNLLVDALAK